MPAIDLAFRLAGQFLPVDHGYALYSALSHSLPDIHRQSPSGAGTPARDIAVHPVLGRLVGDRQLMLAPSSRLVIRVDAEGIPALIPLAGKSLTVNGATVLVGTPEVRTLTPSPDMRARLVTIKGFMEPEPFRAAVQRQLESLDIRGAVHLSKRRAARSQEGTSTGNEERCPYVRRTMRIRDKEVVGYAVEVRELSEADSLRLQEMGLGGRRHFGCGIFVPALRNAGAR